MFSGCLVEDPPDYVAPKQTPPRLDLAKANPPIDRILNLSAGDLVSFRIPVSSEDAGNPIRAYLHLDLDLANAKGQSKEQDADLEPSTLDDTERPELTMTWFVPSARAGCHQVMLLVAHQQNMDDKLGIPTDEADQARAVWWANIDREEDELNSLFDCPGGSSVTD